ncbi:MAG TPA: hypothetical protein VFW40_05240, partial [Capsulimonadaceae bacterium]|nr:hypothetical protein [Capsulimonadaceae bacterium]
QSIAAKTSARIGIAEAADPIQALLATESADADSGSGAAETHFRTELTKALDRLETLSGEAEQAGKPA